MRLTPATTSLVLLMWAATVAAQAPTRAPMQQPTAQRGVETTDISKADLLCARRPDLCPKKIRRVVSFPGQSLPHSSFGSWAYHTRGIEWTGHGGAMSLTLRRPHDYTGGSVRLRFFYEIPGDSEGESMGFSVLPLTMKHGNSFETYGGKSTGLIPAGTNQYLAEQTVVFLPTDPGYRPDWTRDWWFFEISRAGEYDGRIRLMSVAVEY